MIMKFRFIWLLFLGIYQQSFAQYGLGYTERGVISYFSEKYKSKTASGEKFDNNDLVGSHKKIPFNSRVRITNLNNGKSVIVRINDRGPYAYGRIMDISEAAAQKIDLIATGTAKVDIEVVGDGKEVVSNESIQPVENSEKSIPVSASKEAKFITGRTYSLWGTLKNPQGYAIQIGSFANIDNAINYCKNVQKTPLINEKLFIYVAWENYQKVYKILMGEYITEASIEPLKAKILLHLKHIKKLPNPRMHAQVAKD
jgi:rare lipoprotein A